MLCETMSVASKDDEVYLDLFGFPSNLVRNEPNKTQFPHDVTNRQMKFPEVIVLLDLRLINLRRRMP